MPTNKSARDSSLRVGDIVRRKNDPSGRTRVVMQVSSDGEFVTLDEPFERWSTWHVSQLVKVTRR